MYLNIFESTQSKRKFLIRYSPDQNKVNAGEFTITDENGKVTKISENDLYHLIAKGLPLYIA